jgi:hypothetical protein
MFSKPLAVGLLAFGCVTAAAGGAYLAVRQNAAAAPAAVPTQNGPQTPGVRPVAETEAVVVPPAAPAEAAPVRSTTPAVSEPLERTAPRAAAPARRREPASSRLPVSTPPAPAIPEPAPVRAEPAPGVPAALPVPEPARVEAPMAPPAPQFEELIVPAASVIGLRVETPVSSERAQIEDRVEARVTRDVTVDGRVVIPSGARAVGSVTSVDKGGKIKERARLGVRFHTLVLADGTEVPIRTEAIFREGESPAGESSRKIGGAAIGGAILGAIMGGKKGAVVGGATGAAGGTAAVMAGDRNAATLPAGTIVTVRLTAPVTIEVEKG